MYVIEHRPSQRRTQANGDRVAGILLHLAGGGHTTEQTVKAMQYQHTLDSKGQLIIGDYRFTKPSDDCN